MGWCSGTGIFDDVLKAVLDGSKEDFYSYQKGIVEALTNAMWRHDWDCEPDSDYLFNPLVKEVFCELDPRWVDYYKEMEEDG